MGNYVNPGNSGFSRIRSGFYVDKSGLIRLINETIETPKCLTCISRPRRFGKSYAAKMLCAYYDKTCDSSGLFDDLEIGTDEKYHDIYEKHLNKYDVIYLDMTSIIDASEDGEVIPFIKRNIISELRSIYPQVVLAEAFHDTLANAAALTGNKFIMVVDEWDAPIREYPEKEREYLLFLRSLFKNSALTDKIFAAVYMTGILPIKKDKSQSAISDFGEYTMVKPRKFAPYVGFTEKEVRKLCEEQDCDFDQMKQWYDGYEFREAGAVYNPNSVMSAVENAEFDSYWSQTSAAEGLMDYISLDYDGLARTVTELMGGMEVPVNTLGFSNDLVTFRSRDDVLTLLIHLGYLAYNADTKCVRIPNEEIRIEFARTIRQTKREAIVKRVRESDKLLEDTIRGNEEAVAAQIEKIHGEESPLHYNNEQALRSVIKRAYFSCEEEYVMFEEFPGGAGYADIVYLPRRGKGMPILVIELKWDESAEGAIRQIKDRNYPRTLERYGSDILLVGINYDKKAPAGHRKHTCIIEQA